ncbi:MAG: Cys-Gln thioester bond-forming surface protein [Bacilli bacterium]|nr:Cys-Gln thioester bond-forming surface protein [Bacilli bacterium]
MKKKIIFLITLLTIILVGKTVHAEEYTFYEAEYLDKMYMNKYEYATNTIYYQRARLFRNSQTKEIAYCMEPLRFFQEGSIYTRTNAPSTLSEEKLNRIKKIAYFGWRYKDHYDASWYAVAQMMIWRESSSDIGDYYFTDTLNGQRTNAFDYQMDEINQLIESYDREIPVENQTITLVEGMTKEISIGDTLDFYTTDNSEVTLENGVIKIHPLEEGEYTITLHRIQEIVHGMPMEIYESETSQNMIQRGDLDPKEVSFKIKVIQNHIEIHKTDEETDTPQGDASLDGALFELYDEEGNLYDTIEIIQQTGILTSIPFGTYTLKEVSPGIGYELNKQEYTFTLSEENPNYETTISNKVIKKKIILEKTYGEENKPEEKIDFQIWKQEELLDTITTDEEGKAEIILPYGIYIIKQANTTEGYALLEPFTIIIENSEEEIISLHDFKIPVPDTSSISILQYILHTIVMILC